MYPIFNLFWSVSISFEWIISRIRMLHIYMVCVCVCMCGTFDFDKFLFSKWILRIGAIYRLLYIHTVIEISPHHHFHVYIREMFSFFPSGECIFSHFLFLFNSSFFLYICYCCFSTFNTSDMKLENGLYWWFIYRKAKTSPPKKAALFHWDGLNANTV